MATGEDPKCGGSKTASWLQRVYLFRKKGSTAVFWPPCARLGELLDIQVADDVAIDRPDSEFRPRVKTTRAAQTAWLTRRSWRTLTPSSPRWILPLPLSVGRPRRSDNCQPRERAGRVKTAQRRRAVLTRPSAPGKWNTGATRRWPRHDTDSRPNAARVNSIGLAPSSGSIGVWERNRISSSGNSGSVRRASPD